MGGQGAVYRGRHLALDIPVAIKVLNRLAGPQYQAQNVVAQKRFEREAKRSAQLRHSNIVVVHDYGCENGLYYIVTDYVEGLNLRERLKLAKGPLPLAEALAYAQQIGSALQYAHEQGTIHRDIKPSNILLGASPNAHASYKALLCDFGLARLVVDESLDVTTEPGWSPGTPAYMSPEQCLGTPLDARTDIYSFGLVVHEMLTGRHPLFGDSDTTNAVRYRQVHEMPPAPSRLNPSLPAAIDAVVLKAVAKDAAKRYASAAAFVADLEHALGRSPDAGAPTPARKPAALKPESKPRREPRVKPTRKSPRRRRLGCLLVSVVLCLWGLNAWFGWFDLGGLLSRATTTARRPTATQPPVTSDTPVTSGGATAPAPICSQPGVCLSSPRMNQRVSGVLAIEGTAQIEKFQFYKIEIATGEEPAAWSVVHETHDKPVEAGRLEELNSADLPNGVYWLRLVVVDQTGNFPPPAAARIEIRN
jgi:serine/threonine protein kinase